MLGVRMVAGSCNSNYGAVVGVEIEHLFDYQIETLLCHADCRIPASARRVIWRGHPRQIGVGKVVAEFPSCEES